MKYIYLSTVCLGALMCPDLAFSQEQTELDVIVVTGSRSISTATKTETPIVEVPQSISIITNEYLELRNVQRITDALRQSAGVQIDKFGNDVRFEQIQIRGFSATEFGDYRDGLRQSGFSASFFINEPYGVESIEVLKGPSSVLYGENAPGGLVNLVTKMPTISEQFGEFQIDVGNWNRKQVKFDTGGSATSDGDVRYRVTGLVRDAETDLPGESRDDRVYIAPAISWDINEDTQLTLYGQYLDSQGVGAPFGITDTEGNFTNVRNNDPNFDKLEQTQISLGWAFDHELSDNLRFHQQARYSEIDFNWQLVFAFEPEPDQTIIERGAFEVVSRLENIAIENQVIGDFQVGEANITVLAGVDYSQMSSPFSESFGFGEDQGVADFDLDNPVLSGPERPRPEIYLLNEQTNKQLGFYGQTQVKANDWILTLGGRFDDTSADTEDLLNGGVIEQEDSRFTWRAGVARSFESGIVPYFSYSTSFQLVPGFDVGGNPFEPSTGEQIEGGFKYEPSAFPGLITVSIFDLKQKNVLTTDPDNLGGGFSIQTGEITSRGAEFEASLQPVSGLAMGLAYSYIDLKVTESNSGNVGFAPPSAPHHIGSLWARYEFENGPLEGVGFGGALRHTGKSYSDEFEVIENPSSSFGDLFAYYDLDSWRLGLNVDNVTDSEHVTCDFGFCFQVAGRSVLGSLRYRF